MKARGALPWVLVGAVVIAAVLWAVWPSGDGESVGTRVHDLATQLRCPDCEALSVADSSTPSARAIRRDLRRQVKAGRSDEDIRQSYVDRYGEAILLQPEGSGLGFLVWGLPAVALVLGAGGVVLALRRWSRQPRLHATDADEELVARTRENDTP